MKKICETAKSWKKSPLVNPIYVICIQHCQNSLKKDKNVKNSFFFYWLFTIKYYSRIMEQ